MICCCSLAGTEACLHCFNNIKSNKNIYYYSATNLPRKIRPIIQYWCSNCESILIPYQKYCHNCGKEVNWSETFKDAE